MNNPYAGRIDRITRWAGGAFTGEEGAFALAWLEGLDPIVADQVKAMLKKYRASYASGLGKLPGDL